MSARMTASKHVKILRERLSNSIGLPFRDVLSEDMIQQALNEENITYRKRLYDPIITLWIFICQVLDADKSCKNAVKGILCPPFSIQPHKDYPMGSRYKAQRSSIKIIIQRSNTARSQLRTHTGNHER